MRKTITLGTVGIAGLVTAGLLALPIASAVTGEDDPVKRDDDTAEVQGVEDDDGDDADPATGASDGQTRDGQSRDGQSRDGQSRDGQTRDGQTRDGQTRDGATTATGGTHQDATGTAD